MLAQIPMLRHIETARIHPDRQHVNRPRQLPHHRVGIGLRVNQRFVPRHVAGREHPVPQPSPQVHPEIPERAALSPRLVHQNVDGFLLLREPVKRFVQGDEDLLLMRVRDERGDLLFCTRIEAPAGERHEEANVVHARLPQSVAEPLVHQGPLAAADPPFQIGLE